MVARGLEYYWYNRNSVSILLIPLAWIFSALSRLRRIYYYCRNRFQMPLPVPVIVVGNLTVGGTGKTPLVIWLAEFLKSQGFAPGIISRGYGGKSKNWPQFVTANSDPRLVGDEPVLIASHSVCPVAVGRRRTQVARALLKKYNCNVIVSDDGLQHYALLRDIEIVVVDGIRRFGNGYCMPAGPLRESTQRLLRADFVITNGKPEKNEYGMELRGNIAVNLSQSGLIRPLEEFQSQSIVYAIAGIGYPERFFSMLRARGLEVQELAFPDHHQFRPSELKAIDDFPCLMTEKDAVKIKRWARSNYWYVPVTAIPHPAFIEDLIKRVCQ